MSTICFYILTKTRWWCFLLFYFEMFQTTIFIKFIRKSCDLSWSLKKEKKISLLLHICFYFYSPKYHITLYFFFTKSNLFSFCIFFVGQPASNSTRNLMIYLQLRGFLSLLYNTVFIYSPKTSCSVCMLSQNLCYLHSAKFLMASIFKVNADFKAYSNVCLQHCEF